MRLPDLEFSLDRVISYPVEHSAAEGDWIEAKDSGAIPSAMFEFYCAADYFSLEKAPAYLDDPEPVMFPYLANLARGVRDCLVEAAALVAEVREASEAKYTPIKKIRGEKWDEGAPEREIRALKLFLVDVSGALDGFAEVASVLLTEQLAPRVRVGSAQFKHLAGAAEQPESLSGITDPRAHYAEELLQRLRPLLHPLGPDRDWLPTLLLLRNKLAHLGNLYTARLTTLNGPDGAFYTFLPRKWPFMLEQYLTRTQIEPDAESGTGERILREGVIHADLHEYLKCTLQRVLSVLGVGFEVLTSAYETLRELPLNRNALEALDRARRAYEFQYFPDCDETS